MSSQPAEEWDDMSEQTRNEIKARLMAACETRVAVTRPASRDLWAKLAAGNDR